jgi:hypothetical protein
MPIQLSDEQQKALIKRILDTGGSKEEAFSFLDEKMGIKPRENVSHSDVLSNISNIEFGNELRPALAQHEINREAEAKSYVKETLPRQAVAMGTGLALSPLTGAMSIPAAALVDTAAIGGADLAYQGVRKVMDPNRQIDPMQSLEIGVGAGLTGGATKIGLEGLAALSNVAPQFVRYFRNIGKVGRFNRTMGQVETANPAIPGLVKTGEQELGQAVKGAMKDWTGTMTPSRLTKEAIINNATQSGVKINSQPIIDALEDVKLATPKTSVGLKLNTDLSKIQNGFKRVITIPAPSNVGNTFQKATPTTRSVVTDITPKELDEFLTKEIDNRIYSMSGSPKNQMLAKSLADAREKIRATLLGSLPPEAAAATKTTFDELTQMEGVARSLQPNLVSLENKMRNAFKPGNQHVVDSLKTLSDKSGIDFVGRAFKYAQQRAFSGDPRVADQSIGLFFEAIKKFIARPMLKTLAPLQSLAGPAGGAGTAAIVDKIPEATTKTVDYLKNLNKGKENP